MRSRRRSTTTATRSRDRKSTRLNSSHVSSSYAVLCLKKKNDESSKLDRHKNDYDHYKKYVSNESQQCEDHTNHCIRFSNFAITQITRKRVFPGLRNIS